MHELSLIRDTFRTLESEFSAEEMQRLSCIKMKIGKLSNVEPLLLQNAFAAVKEDKPQYTAVELQIDLTPILVFCKECGKTTEVENYRFVCACGKPTSEIISGTELLIHQVEFLEAVG